MLTERDMELIGPLGGKIIIKKLVDSIIDAVASVRWSAGQLYDDVKHCEAIGEMCRAKVNENIRFLAQGQGQEVSICKPEKTRYGNVLIRVGDIILTVGRGYGNHHVVKRSGFKNDFANPLQMRLNLFGDDDRAYTVPDVPGTSLIVAWDIEPNQGKPYVSCIELQQVLHSPQRVVHKIDLLAEQSNIVNDNISYVYDDDLNVKPRIEKKRINNA